MVAESSFTERCRQIAAQLERSVEHHPREIEKEADEIERELVQLRNDLIVQCREKRPGIDREHAQRRLEYVNIALSLVVAVEYPLTSIQRSALKQARETLETFLR